jgi:hypothetical protein
MFVFLVNYGMIFLDRIMIALIAIVSLLYMSPIRCKFTYVTWIFHMLMFRQFVNCWFASYFNAIVTKVTWIFHSDMNVLIVFIEIIKACAL